jgi:hypothetical protein
MSQSGFPFDKKVNAEHELDTRQRVNQETIRPSVSRADFARATRPFSRKPIQQRDHFRADLDRRKFRCGKRVVVIEVPTPRQLVAQRLSPTDLKPKLGCGGHIRQTSEGAVRVPHPPNATAQPAGQLADRADHYHQRRRNTGRQN